MNINTLVIGFTLLMTSISASAGHWQIAGGFCQTLSEDDSFMLRIKPDNIGIIERTPDCSGRGTFPMTGSNVAFNHTAYPSSALCTNETRRFAVQIMMSTKDIASVISVLKENEHVPVSAFGTQFDIDASGFSSTCGEIINQKVADFDPLEAQDKMMRSYGYEKAADGTWQKKSAIAMFQAQSGKGIDVKINRPSVDVPARRGDAAGPEYSTDTVDTGEANAVASGKPAGAAGHDKTDNTPRTAEGKKDIVNASCTLDNGKTVRVFAAKGQDYLYTYADKNQKVELELREGASGVRAFHYQAQPDIGETHYVRFNKGHYDYVLLSRNAGVGNFYGLKVYSKGSQISSHECKTHLSLDVSRLSADHTDNKKMGDFITNH